MGDQEYELAKVIELNDINLLKEILNKNNYMSQITSASFKLPGTKKYLPYDSLSLLHIAAFYDSLESFLYLEEILLNGKQPMSLNQILTIKTAASYYPLHYALSNGSVEVSRYIIDRLPEQTGLADEGVIYFPLELAVLGGMHELVELLFENDKGTITDTQINRAFQMAILTRNYYCLKILIDKRTSKGKDSNTQETIAMKAASVISPEAVSLVIKHEPHQLNKIFYPRTNSKPESDCLLSRLFRANPPVFKEQIKEVINKLDGSIIEPDCEARVKGPCHWICYLCDIEIAHLMFAHFSIKVNRLDQSYKTGPYEMVRPGLDQDNIIKMLDFLVSNDFNVNLITYENGVLCQKTLLEEFVTFSGFLPKVIEHLLVIGADPDAPTFIQKGRYGTIRNYVLKRKGNKQLIEIFNRHPPKAEQNNQ